MKTICIFKNIAAVIIDILFIVLIQQLFRITTIASDVTNTYVLVISFALYVLFAFLSQWETFGRKWMKLTNAQTGSQDKKVRSSSLCLALLIDFFLIFSLTILIDRLLRSFVFIETLMLLMVVAPLYYIFCYAFFRTTIGKYFFGIQLATKKEVDSFGWQMCKREIAKFGIGYWLPMILLYYILDWNHLYLNFARILSFNIVVLLLYSMIKKELWWDTIGGTYKQRLLIPQSKKTVTGASIFIFIVFSYLILLAYNNVNNPSNDKIAGFHVPFKRIEYPNNSKVIPYQTFIEEYGQDPKEYLLGLFDEYDIVVLCENLHFEDTQWDFIYEVVSDTRFIENVGTIFTEYGDAKDQIKVDTFMQATFTIDTLLAKAAARLAAVDQSGHFHLFMQKLYRLNNTLPDSLKIREHFTDIGENDYLHGAYLNVVNLGDVTDPIIQYRDSLMAQVVIDWYVQNQKKCLVITNYRHAFIVNREVQEMKKVPRAFRENEAQYIYNTFPNKTVNVMLHGITSNALNYLPIHKGKWERVLKNLDYTPVGFNLRGSPFGKDYFDRFPAFKRSYPFQYEDIFFGYIFYTPEKEWRTSNPLYARYAAEEEYKYAAQHQLIDTVKGQMLLANFHDAEKTERGNLHPLMLLLNSCHFMDLLVWFLFGIMAIFSIVFRTVLPVRKKKYT